MRTLHAYDSFDPKRGGPPVAIIGLCRGLSQAGCDSALFSFRRGHEVENPLLAGLSHFRHRPRTPLRLLPFLPVERAVQDLVRGRDLVHVAGPWAVSSMVFARCARHMSKPYVCTLHGTLAPWCLAISGWKKRIAKVLYVNRLFRRSSALHALNAEEARAARAYGYQGPIAVIPNGVDLIAAVERSTGRGPGPWEKTILFMSRIHPVKGLRELIAAWCEIARDFPQWGLLVAGYDETGLRAELEQMVRAGGGAGQCQFRGHLEGDDKRSAWQHADVFVLPSYSEGFSMSILEALANQVPALISPQCNFPEAIRAGAAVSASPEGGALQEGLRQILSLSDEQRRQMGAAGLRLVRERYTWDQVARQMILVYEWIRRGGERPACVQ